MTTNSNILTTEDLISSIRASGGVTKAQAHAILEGLKGTIKQAVHNGQQVRIHSVGTFGRAIRKEGTKRNPRTQETVNVPKHYVVKFKVSRDFRESVASIPIA